MRGIYFSIQTYQGKKRCSLIKFLANRGFLSYCRIIYQSGILVPYVKKMTCYVPCCLLAIMKTIQFMQKSTYPQLKIHVHCRNIDQLNPHINNLDFRIFYKETYKRTKTFILLHISQIMCYGPISTYNFCIDLGDRRQQSKPNYNSSLKIFRYL